jgi:acetoin utilization deacetylase AcuC-like enzyme
VRRRTGDGKGLGCNINAPLSSGCGDREHIQALEEKLKPRAIAFDADFVISLAGFDAHKYNSLGGMWLTAKDFAEMAQIVK